MGGRLGGETTTHIHTRTGTICILGQPAEQKLVQSLQSATDDVLPYSTLDDEQFQLLDAYICISSHYRQLYSRNILCSCLKQPQHFNNSPFNYIETVDGSFVNRFPILPGTCC